MLATILIGLREGLEAALIIGIILAYLAVIDRHDLARKVWTGVFAALALSLIGGVAIFLIAGEVAGRAGAIFEGVATGTAVLVLTYMVFWMKKQARNIKGELHAQIDKAIDGSSKSLLALPVLGFIAVIREGIETVLMTFAAVNAASNTGLNGWMAVSGVLIGIVISSFLGYLVYKGGVRLNLRSFFTITGTALIIIAAGLAGYATKEFISAGLIPSLIYPLYDVSHILPNSGDNVLGSILKGMIGYNPKPSLTEFMIYWGYLISCLVFFYKHPKPKTATAVVQTQA